jgi:hypothetical protein
VLIYGEWGGLDNDPEEMFNHSVGRSKASHISECVQEWGIVLK